GRRRYLLEDRIPQVQEDALAHVSGGESRRVEALDDAEHPLRILDGIGLLLFAVVTPLRAALAEEIVEQADDLVQRALEVPFIVDVADDLLAQQKLTRRNPEQRELVLEMVGEVAGS